MNQKADIKEGQVLTGPLFNEPMRVETVQPAGPTTWVLGLVGMQSERFRKVTLTSGDLEKLTILHTGYEFNGCAPEPGPEPEPTPSPKTKTIRLTGSIPPEIWNRFGTKIIPKIRSGKDVSIEVKFSTTVELTVSKSLESELRQLLQDLGISDKIKIE